MSAAKILAVDDEPDFELLITQRFRRQIREKEFEFRFAHHGGEALEALAAEPDINLMLLDINMPVMDGLTLLGSAARATRRGAHDHRLGLWRYAKPAYGDEPRRL
jgi:CheY-like chemotaxis protein